MPHITPFDAPLPLSCTLSPPPAPPPPRPLCVCPHQAKIKEELQAESVVVSDVYGDGRHVSIDVVSSTFEGG